MQEFYRQGETFRRWLEYEWGIDVAAPRQDIAIEGSPERTVSRVVIQDKKGILYLLEKFTQNKFDLRERVARAVAYVHENGLGQALPYYRTCRGVSLPFFDGACYQLSRFHFSTPLSRPEYLSCANMGSNFARFLIDMDHAARGIDTRIPFPQFSIKTYVYQIFGDMKHHDPEVYENFGPVLSFLEKTFMEVHDRIPLRFCHGDLHPLNVIWLQDDIKAVIDWEFAGIKPEIYDAANLVGCAGIEDPRGLAQPMVMTFIRQMQRFGRISELGWQYFFEYLISLRFAWLSEWLRKRDERMIEMEEVYMKLLIENREVIRAGWQLPGN